MTTAQLESARTMIPGSFEPNAPPHRQPNGVAAALTEPVGGATALQGPYVMTASPQPATWAAQSANVLGDLALVVGLVFALVLVPVLAIKGVAVAAGFLLDTLRGNG